MLVLARILTILASISLLVFGLGFLFDLQLTRSQNILSVDGFYHFETIRTLYGMSFIVSGVYGFIAATKIRKKYILYLGLHVLLMALVCFGNILFMGHESQILRDGLVSLIIFLLLMTAHLLFSKSNYQQEFKAM